MKNSVSNVSLKEGKECSNVCIFSSNGKCTKSSVTKNVSGKCYGDASLL